ncbi:probable carboxylesterase 12 isoform X2 [Prosopis cineraria]|uniref:probable carboxylesterase 12 isoform X2 n=1 Tax=Prosopis cineraria TaxID=364024 RepID=UPI00240F772A|nr:probable carboxylesterase 12 isoform X2 [Prosopis cineraria]
MTSSVFFTALSQPKYHSALLKPYYPLPKGVFIHSFPLSSSLPSPLPPRLPSLKLSSPSSASNSASDEVAYDFSPVMKVYRDGRIQRLAGVDVVPPGIDPETDVESKDVVISEHEAISARIFLPRIAKPDQKLPLLVHFHGGGFCIESAFSPAYKIFLNSVTSRANVICVSVNYRNAPEYPVPTGHEDSWTAVRWVASHFGGNGPDEWLNRHADLGKVVFIGDSTGANIAHHMAIRVGLEKPSNLMLEALILVQPFFWGEERTESERNQATYAAKLDRLWKFLCPSALGGDDPLVNPEKDPDLGKLDCKRVLVCVAEEDLMRDRGLNYRELVEKNGFSGDMNVLETRGENHAFHLFKPGCENTVALLTSIASYINQFQEKTEKAYMINKILRKLFSAYPVFPTGYIV